MRTSVIAGCDPAPILEPAEGVFDAVTLAVEHAVVWKQNFA